MSQQCEHTICLDLHFSNDICLDLGFETERCIDICFPGKGLNLAFCDIIGLGYEEVGECDVAIASIISSGADIVITASSSKTLYYQLLDLEANVVVSHQLSSTFSAIADGSYIVQVSNEDQCNQYQIFQHTSGA